MGIQHLIEDAKTVKNVAVVSKEDRPFVVKWRDVCFFVTDPNAEVKVAVEIQANFTSGASDQTKRAVTENARTLNFKNADWE